MVKKPKVCFLTCEKKFSSQNRSINATIALFRRRYQKIITNQVKFKIVRSLFAKKKNALSLQIYFLGEEIALVCSLISSLHLQDSFEIQNQFFQLVSFFLLQFNWDTSIESIDSNEPILILIFFIFILI